MFEEEIKEQVIDIVQEVIAEEEAIIHNDEEVEAIIEKAEIGQVAAEVEERSEEVKVEEVVVIE